MFLRNQLFLEILIRTDSRTRLATRRPKNHFPNANGKNNPSPCLDSQEAKKIPTLHPCPPKPKRPQQHSLDILRQQRYSTSYGSAANIQNNRDDNNFTLYNAPKPNNHSLALLFSSSNTKDREPIRKRILNNTLPILPSPANTTSGRRTMSCPTFPLPTTPQTLLQPQSKHLSSV